MTKRCGICSRLAKNDVIVCTGTCRSTFHINCASTEYEIDLHDSNSFAGFVCGPCRLQKSPSQPLVPPQNSSANITLEEVMKQLQANSNLINSNLASFQDQITNRFEALTDTLNGVVRDISELRSEVTNLASSQESMTQNITRLQTDVGTLDIRTKNIETENSALKSQLDGVVTTVANLKSQLHTPGVVIRNLPATLQDSPRAIVEKVLTALGIPDLASDIFDIRTLTRKNSNAVGDQRNTQTPSHSLSFLVCFKSTAVRDHVLSKKRVKKVLTISEVFSLNLNGNVTIQEFLPPEIHKLLNRVRSVAKDKGWKHAWGTGKGVFVRKTDGSQIVTINSDADFEKII